MKIRNGTILSPRLEKSILADDEGGRNTYEWSFKGTIEIADTWVIDGFELTPDRLQSIIEDGILRDLSMANGQEVVVTSRVTAAPPAATIHAAQNGTGWTK